jgi:catechol 2,3-dioxygenase-like lactoylglutathione lyase family enzyme
VLDPEGNKVEFVEPPRLPQEIAAPSVIGHHIMHMGIMVHSRAVEDTFYRDLLGFRPYWFGGMVEGRLDWVSQQTPDSHDWLEYMLTSGPSGSGIPATISQHDLGVLDHLSIGVNSVEAAHKTLEAGNRLTGVHDAHTQIGKDGKGQFNLYDPDGIRLELMNFHATRKALLLTVYRRRPGGVRQSGLRKNKINRTFVMNGTELPLRRCPVRLEATRIQYLREP